MHAMTICRCCLAGPQGGRMGPQVTSVLSQSRDGGPASFLEAAAGAVQAASDRTQAAVAQRLPGPAAPGGPGSGSSNSSGCNLRTAFPERRMISLPGDALRVRVCLFRRWRNCFRGARAVLVVDPDSLLYLRQANRLQRQQRRQDEPLGQPGDPGQVVRQARRGWRRWRHGRLDRQPGQQLRKRHCRQCSQGWASQLAQRAFRCDRCRGAAPAASSNDS